MRPGWRQQDTVAKMSEDRPLSIDDVIRWRRDVRRFKPDPVSPDVLAELLALADYAPSVGNSQPWRVVLVETPERRQLVRQSFEVANGEAAASYASDRQAVYRGLKLAGFDAAPVHIAVFCDDGTAQGDGLGARTMPEMRRYSCVSMITVLWLAARARGLGLGWVSILDPGEVARALDQPHDRPLVGYLLLGWPEEEHLDPELERFGWQARTPADGRIVTV